VLLVVPTSTTVKLPYLRELRESQLSLPSRVPGCLVVDAFGLGLMSDGLHLATGSQLELGRRMAEAWAWHGGEDKGEGTDPLEDAPPEVLLGPSELRSLWRWAGGAVRAAYGRVVAVLLEQEVRQAALHQELSQAEREAERLLRVLRERAEVLQRYEEPGGGPPDGAARERIGADMGAGGGEVDQALLLRARLLTRQVDMLLSSSPDKAQGALTPPPPPVGASAVALEAPVGISSSSLTYGEVELLSFLHMLWAAAPRAGGRSFVDLGVGDGKLALAALSSCLFERVAGVDVIAAHCERTQGLLDVYREMYPEAGAVDCEVVCADVLAWDFSHATFVYGCFTCFSDCQLAVVAAQAQKLRAGSRFVSVDKQLPVATEGALALVMCCQCMASWGLARMFVYERVA
jgi:hypothetical protein